MNKILASTAIILIMTVFAFSQTPVQEQLFTVPDINGRSTLLIKPDLPADAALKIDGRTIGVRVVVNTDGVPILATCLAPCPDSYKTQIEKAATQSRFAPLISNGKAIQYDGILLYSFAEEKVNWFRFGTALNSTYIFSNISVGPAAACLTLAYHEEKSQLRQLDNGVDQATRRKTIQSVVTSLKKKLGTREAWLFELGIALRIATAPTMMPNKMDRSDVQQALGDMAKFVDRAPAVTPKQLLDDLRTISNYKVDMEMSEQDLRREISKLASKINPEP